jgi:Tfp pilus assembly protein PilN
MIRINLLGGPKAAPEAAGPAAVAPGAIIVAVAVLVALGLVSALSYFVVEKDIQNLDTQISEQKREQARLAGIKAQAVSYLRTLNELKLQKDTVDALAKSRVGPVELMRALGVTATRDNDLFLNTVTNQAGHLAIEGTSGSITAVADFLGNLQKSGAFDNVQLRQSFQNNKGSRLSYNFSIDCVFKPSSSAQEAPAGAPAAPARRAGL